MSVQGDVFDPAGYSAPADRYESPLPVDIAAMVALEDWGPKADVTEGAPQESGMLLSEEGGVLIGVWALHTWRWTSEGVGVGELMHFVAGERAGN